MSSFLCQGALEPDGKEPDEVGSGAIQGRMTPLMTILGTRNSVVFPIPSCPEAFEPQQYVSPAVVMAQV